MGAEGSQLSDSEQKEAPMSAFDGGQEIIFQNIHSQEELGRSLEQHQSGDL